MNSFESGATYIVGICETNFGSFSMRILFLVVLLLSGCASAPVYTPPPPQLRITFITDPPGAVLYQNGVRLDGYAPLTLSYDPNATRKLGGNITEVTARWQSGASITIKPHINPDESYSWTQTITRPAIPGRDIDEQVEAMRQQQQAQQIQQQQQYQQQQQQQSSESNAALSNIVNSGVLSNIGQALGGALGRH